MAAPDWLRSLPDSWGFGITRGGRVFFISEEANSTTWLHPVTGEAVLTGHRKSPDLPTGWEEGYTFEGARYYINHNERKVTCTHPVTGQPSQDNCIFVVNEQTPSKDRTVSMTSEASNCNVQPSVNSASPPSRSSRSSGKVHNFGKRSNSIKRNPNAPVSMRGWLYKKANSGMKLWKKRWFVLSDLCLFYYRDEKEEGVLGSILLPSFFISVVIPEDHINRTFAFKAAHSNMRTYYFCTDTAKEMELWMRGMIDASLAHSQPTKRVDPTKGENIAPQDINHIANHKLLIRPEANNNLRNKELNREEELKALEAEKYGFQQDGKEKPLTKITSGRHPHRVSDYETLQANTGHYRPVLINGPESQGLVSETDSADHRRSVHSRVEPEAVIQRTNSMLQLGQWIQAQRDKELDVEPKGVMSYQTLPRNMPSHHTQTLPRYPEGYRTLPRNMKSRPDSLCSTAGMGYERTLAPMTATNDEKRRSIRDDTMWQLYEWQQRQFYNKQGTIRRHASLTSPRTMIHISDQTLHSIPISPSHGSISGYHTYSPHRAFRSEVSSPIQIGDITIDRRQKAFPNKHAFAPDRRSMPVGLSLQPITSQGLQSKTPEELTLLLIKLRRQQAELSSVREYTLAQLMRLKPSCSPKNEILSHHLQRNLIYVDHQMKENEPLITMVHTMIENSALRPQLFQQMAQDDSRGGTFKYRSEDVDIDAKLSQLCEQDKGVQALEQKLQQLHKEKYTLEQALVSVSQEIETQGDNAAAIQSVVLQRDELQSGLLSTCREVSRATTELERSWREYDKLERDVTAAQNRMKEKLERLGGVQSETSGIQRAQMQKEIWRIQDVMEGLSKHKEQRRSKESAGNCDPDLVPSEMNTNENPDYRLYKSEPELTTVAEVDETNPDDKSEAIVDLESGASKVSHYPVGVVSPRTKSPPLESTTIASYVTLRKGKKIETKSERPRSAVDHLCIADYPRTRMTVEEQLERMKKHQQACLREKKKGFSLFGASDLSPSLSPSFSRENSLKMLRRRDDKIFSNIKDIESCVRGETSQKRESPAEEILRLKEGAGTEVRESSAMESFAESDAKDVTTREAHDPTDPASSILTSGETSPQTSPSVTNHSTDSCTNNQEDVAVLLSYEFTTERLTRRTSLEDAPTEPHTMSNSPAQPQLSEGTHFMCV